MYSLCGMEGNHYFHTPFAASRGVTLCTLYVEGWVNLGTNLDVVAERQYSVPEPVCRAVVSSLTQLAVKFNSCILILSFIANALVYTSLLIKFY